MMANNKKCGVGVAYNARIGGTVVAMYNFHQILFLIPMNEHLILNSPDIHTWQCRGIVEAVACAGRMAEKRREKGKQNVAQNEYRRKLWQSVVTCDV
jgi:hypothetical protein